MRVELHILVAAALIALTPPTFAFDPKLPPLGLPTAAMYGAALLPERDGVVSWTTFADVESVRQGSRVVPEFGKAVLALDRQRVRIQGFIVPLEVSDRRHFLVSAVPPHCPFCLPAGPDAIVEVWAKAPVAWGIEPITIAGRLEVLRDDPSGVLYRLSDAEAVVKTSR